MSKLYGDTIVHSHARTNPIGFSNVDFGEDRNVEYGYYARYFDRLIEEMIELVKAGYEIVWGKTENWCSINGTTYNVPKDVWDIRSNPNYVKEPLQSPRFGKCDGKLYARPITVTEMINSIMDAQPGKYERVQLYKIRRADLVSIYNDAVSL